MTYFEKIIKHFIIITQHKWEVFKLCCRAGIIWQGITHDLSKYSFIEFFEYAKYYNGVSSPIDEIKKDKGYSLAWLHHRGINPHHYEYWVDKLDNGGVPLIMPFNYVLEMLCDMIAANKVYNKNKKDGNSFENSLLNFWNNKKKTAKIHPSIIKFCEIMILSYNEGGDEVLDGGINNLKRIYLKCVNDVSGDINV